MRARDLVHSGVSRARIYRLVDRGDLIRVGRGLYAPAFPEGQGRSSYVEIAQRAPSAVICLLSALAFHEITTQVPAEVWIAVDRKAWQPKIGWPPVRVVRFSGAALSEGIEEHTLEGATVRVYSVAKTVADCFKYRNKVGLDVAIEALRDAVRGKRATVDELWRYARVCRVTTVMRPYLEATL
jgi:predicted transcriptional regulator of viral defense system